MRVRSSRTNDVGGRTRTSSVTKEISTRKVEKQDVEFLMILS